MSDELTVPMQKALAYAREHGDKLVRHPGGYWAKADWLRWKDPHFGTSTVEALVKRGYGVYSAWKAGRAGLFPIEITVRH